MQMDVIQKPKPMAHIAQATIMKRDIITAGDAGRIAEIPRLVSTMHAPMISQLFGQYMNQDIGVTTMGAQQDIFMF